VWYQGESHHLCISHTSWRGGTERTDEKAFEDGKVDNSPEHIKEYIEGTIARLGSTPDLYYLHRIDPEHDLSKSIPALDQLKKDGKTRYIGLSECNAQTLRKACSCKSILCQGT
jgi:aryl-alcohol dehydrogenase-like predicted oxidoreductase